jgi:hypothetical protein
VGGIGSALHWDGSAWRAVLLPKIVVQRPNYDPTTYIPNLVSIGMRAPSDVWAAGPNPDPSSNRTRKHVLWHWDGEAWKVVDASKEILPGGATQHWPGELWNNLAHQTPQLPEGHLYSDVQVLPSGDVWAVGGYESGSDEGYALAAHYSSMRGTKQCP